MNILSVCEWNYIGNIIIKIKTWTVSKLRTI